MAPKFHERMKSIIPILLVLLGSQACAQEFYITSYDYTTFLNTISVVDASLNVTPVKTFDLNGNQILDIAFAPNGALYGTLTDAIIELNLQSGTHNEVYKFPIPGSYNSLVCNDNSEILALEYNTSHLITIDITTLSEVSDIILDESSPGDLTFFQGNLIYQGQLSNNILDHDGTSVRTVACPIARPSGEPFLFFGLSNYTSSCEDDLVYGFSEDGYIYSLDIASNTHEEVGVLQISPNYASLNGSTTINEYIASSCPLADLNEVSCTVQVREDERPNLSLYPNPVTDVLHIQDLDMQDVKFFTLYSPDGRKLMEGILTNEIDLSPFPSGIYLMKVHNRSKTLSIAERIVKG